MAAIVRSAMRKEVTPPPPGDPYIVLSYLIGGVVLYGAVGWLLDRWLGTSFIVGIGIVVGAGLGVYLTMKRFTVTEASDRPRKDLQEEQEERQENQ